MAKLKNKPILLKQFSNHNNHKHSTDKKRQINLKATSTSQGLETLSLMTTKTTTKTARDVNSTKNFTKTLLKPSNH